MAIFNLCAYLSVKVEANIRNSLLFLAWTGIVFINLDVDCFEAKCVAGHFLGLWIGLIERRSIDIAYHKLYVANTWLKAPFVVGFNSHLIKNVVSHSIHAIQNAPVYIITIDKLFQLTVRWGHSKCHTSSRWRTKNENQYSITTIVCCVFEHKRAMGCVANDYRFSEAITIFHDEYCRFFFVRECVIHIRYRAPAAISLS